MLKESEDTREMYAIRNKKSGKYVYETDYRCEYNGHGNTHIYRQFTSFKRALTYEYISDVMSDFLTRGISANSYEVVEVDMVVKAAYPYSE